ncbi:MAG: hypothetical protein WDN24_01325 [Sphingomonas sp.]
MEHADGEPCPVCSELRPPVAATSPGEPVPRPDPAAQASSQATPALAVTTAARDDAQAKDQPRPRKTAAGGGGGAGAGIPEDVSTLASVRELRESGRFIIGLIGYRTGGKTFFLNRLKYEQAHKHSCHVWPDYAPDLSKVQGTSKIELHTITLKGGGPGASVTIVDIPGERLKALTDNKFGLVTAALRITSLCDALIVALPSDQVLLSRYVRVKANNSGGIETLMDQVLTQNPENLQNELKRLGRIRTAQRTPEQKQRILTLKADLKKMEEARRDSQIAELHSAHASLTDFTMQLSYMAAILCYMNEHGEESVETIDRSVIDQYMDTEKISYPKPSFIALTKTDLIAKPDELLRNLFDKSPHKRTLANYRRDPIDTVAKLRPELVSRFSGWFGRLRFDFVTAFEDLKDETIDYAAHHKGVHAVIDWITRTAQADIQPATFKQGLERAQALRARRDGSQGSGPFWGGLRGS